MRLRSPMLYTRREASTWQDAYPTKMPRPPRNRSRFAHWWQRRVISFPATPFHVKLPSETSDATFVEDVFGHRTLRADSPTSASAFFLETALKAAALGHAHTRREAFTRRDAKATKMTRSSGEQRSRLRTGGQRRTISFPAAPFHVKLPRETRIVEDVFVDRTLRTESPTSTLIYFLGPYWGCGCSLLCLHAARVTPAKNAAAGFRAGGQLSMPPFPAAPVSRETSVKQASQRSSRAASDSFRRNHRVRPRPAPPRALLREAISADGRQRQNHSSCSRHRHELFSGRRPHGPYHYRKRPGLSADVWRKSPSRQLHSHSRRPCVGRRWTPFHSSALGACRSMPAARSECILRPAPSAIEGPPRPLPRKTTPLGASSSRGSASTASPRVYRVKPGPSFSSSGKPGTLSSSTADVCPEFPRDAESVPASERACAGRERGARRRGGVLREIRPPASARRR